MVSLFAASPDEEWVYVAHDILAFALAGLLVVKMRRVWRRLVTPSEWDRLVKPGVLASLLVAGPLVGGWGGGRGGGPGPGRGTPPPSHPLVRRGVPAAPGP